MPRVYKETAANVERFEFDGKIYRRYPDSPRRHLRRYFSRSGRFLHRDIWEFHNGPIPEGYQVHHKDGDHLNNDIRNLECITRARHEELHSAERSALGRSDAQVRHLASIREKAADWHKSEEGRRWHAEHGKASWEGRTPTALVCRECGAGFESFRPDASFCSKKCQWRNWSKRNPGHDAEKRARAKARRLQHQC